MNKYKRILMCAWPVVILVISLCACQPRQLSALDEGGELVSLYLVLNAAREESATILAELLLVKEHPERVGVEEVIGDPQPLESAEDLIARLEGNRSKINSSLSEIKKRSLADPDRLDEYQQALQYFDQLALFEDHALDAFSRVGTKEEFAQYINLIFETENGYPALIQRDEEFVNLLIALASRHNMEIEAQTYDEILRKRLGKLWSPIVTEQTGQVKYEFTIPKYIYQENVVVSWAGVSIDNFVFGLEHPDGRRINFRVAPINEDVYGIEVPINTLPIDGSVVLIPSEEYPSSGDVALASNVSRIYYEKDTLTMNIYPDDPILAPVEGSWNLYIIAPSGLELIMGAFYIPSMEATTRAERTPAIASAAPTATPFPEPSVQGSPHVTPSQKETAPSATQSPTRLPTIDPTQLSDQLRKAFSIQSLDGVNGHKLSRITGWNYGFHLCYGGYRWMDAHHLLLFPSAGQEDESMGRREWTRPVVIDLRTGNAWLPPPDAPTADCGRQEWSQALGILISSDNGETITFTPEGNPLGRFPGSLSDLSPSGTKIMTGDTWIDLRTGEIVDFGWELAQWPYQLAWSYEETRLFQCCYNYGNARTGEGHSFNLPDGLHPAGRGIPSLLNIGASWVLDDSYVLIDWDFNADKVVHVPLIDPVSQTYQDLHDLADIPGDVYCGGFPEVAPGGEYVWLRCGRPGESIGYLIHLATFQAEPYSEFYLMSWSKDGGYALIGSYNDDPIRVLALSSKVLEPLPTYSPGRSYAWHPAGGVLAYFSEAGHTLVVLDAQTWSAQEIALPSAFNSVIWNPSGSDMALVADDGSLWQAQYPCLEAVEQLSPPLASVHSLSWSPDGTSLALISGTDIYMVEAIELSHRTIPLRLSADTFQDWTITY